MYLLYLKESQKKIFVLQLNYFKKRRLNIIFVTNNVIIQHFIDYSRNNDPGHFLGNFRTFPDETLKCEISSHVDGEISNRVNHAQKCGARIPIGVGVYFCFSSSFPKFNMQLTPIPLKTNLGRN